MQAFWNRLLGVERRVERYLRAIRELQRQIRDLQQQLAQQRGG